VSKPKTTVTPHPFQADPKTPGDPISGDQVCRCGLVGRAGDSHHTMPDPVPDVAGLAAGEGDR
jgi:hypothetical protein